MKMYGPKPCSRRLPKCWQGSKQPANTSKWGPSRLSSSDSAGRARSRSTSGRTPALFDNSLRMRRPVASDPAVFASFGFVIRHEEVLNLGDALPVELSEIGEFRR